MPADTPLWMYLISALAFLVFLYGFVEMVRVWRKGKPWKPGSWRAGAKRLVVAMATHRKFMREEKPGLMHAWIFWGFVVLFIGTTIVAIDYDIFEQLLGSKLLAGNGYLVFELVLDLFGVLFVVGLSYALWRRLKIRPKHLHKSASPEAPRWLMGVSGDVWALVLLLAIGLTGFMLEAVRLRHQMATDGIAYAQWSFVGHALGIPLRAWTPERLASVYPALWYTHFLLWSAVLAVLPWTKLRHIFTSSLNVYFHDPARQSRPELPTPFRLEEVLAGGADVPDVGVKTIRDFTWKARLSFDACTNCGRCEAECPAHAAGRVLSPRKLIQDLKAEMWRDYREGESRPLASAQGVGAAVQEATLWSCTTCRACVTACPVDIEHVDHIMEMRRGLVMESRLDENQQKLLVNLTNAGNPYGFAASDRANWTSKLPAGVRVRTVAELAGEGKKAEWLWWVGCSGSYDPRNQEVTVAVATLLASAGVDVAILGTEERCNGDPARRLGEEGRFQQSVMENAALFKQYGITKVLTQCPHCFNTLRNEYRALGVELEVLHHAELLERLVSEGKIPLKAGKEVKITYHDSCYLMRHNGIADAPRKLLAKANGLPVLEMVQNRDKGLCCGAGGSNMWFEVKPEKERINVIRAKQAADTGAQTVATACPFCLTMMGDGLSLTGQDGMQARDLAEILLDHLDWTPPTPETPVEAAAPAPSSGGWSG